MPDCRGRKDLSHPFGHPLASSGPGGSGVLTWSLRQPSPTETPTEPVPSNPGRPPRTQFPAMPSSRLGKGRRWAERPEWEHRVGGCVYWGVPQNPSTNPQTNHDLKGKPRWGQLPELLKPSGAPYCSPLLLRVFWWKIQKNRTTETWKEREV